MTAEQMAAVNNALNPGMQLALPQTVVPVTKTQHQVSRVQYNPEKLQALVNALQAPRSKQQIAKDKWEMLGNALANNMESPTYEGAYGVKFTNPLTDALVGSAKTFSDLYGGFKQQERDLANQDVELQNLAREDAIKAAQLEAEATKQAISDQVVQDYMKINDPFAKTQQEQAKNQEALNALYALKERNKQNVVGFDEKFDVKNPDGTINIEKTMANYKGQNPHGLFGRNWTSPNSFWGWGESKNEADVRQKFQAFKETQLRNVYDTLRGAGAITEKELETMGKTAEKATNPYELDLAISEFIKNIEAKKEMPQKTNKYTVEIVNE